MAATRFNEDVVIANDPPLPVLPGPGPRLRPRRQAALPAVRGLAHRAEGGRRPLSGGVVAAATEGGRRLGRCTLPCLLQESDLY